MPNLVRSTHFSGEDEDISQRMGVYLWVYMCVCIYLFIEREGEREEEAFLR